MKKILSLVASGIVLGSGAGLFIFPIPAAAQAATDEAGYEELTRGPVHEAFAESVNFNPTPGIIVDVAPPDPVDELPPELKPEGDNVLWIPGYWMWDEDTSDYLWISGVWRDIPPGRQWTPGYWNDLESGEWQWVAGYWEDTDRSELDYISTAPPETLETGPSVAAPAADQAWIPGNWLWVEKRYIWRPGYWSPLRTGWTWVPARYVWTPLGYVFVDGYWDYEVARRGVLFAPVRFHHHVWSRPGYYYRPSIVVSLNVFSDHLFYRSRACHYYFGDYYDSRYRRRGFDPVFAWHARRAHYDPIFAYQRWSHRDQRNWLDRRRDRFDYLTRHADARPARTWSAMRRLNAGRSQAGADLRFASTLADVAGRKSNRWKFERLSRDRVNRIAEQGRKARGFAANRKQWERPGASRAASGKKLRERLSAMPLRSREAQKLGKTRRPPERLEPRGRDLIRQAMQRTKQRPAVRAGKVPAAGRKARAAETVRPGNQRRPEAANRGQNRQGAQASGQRLRDAARGNQGKAQQAVPQRKARGIPQRAQPTPQRKSAPPRATKPRKSAKPEVRTNQSQAARLRQAMQDRAQRQRAAQQQRALGAQQQRAQGGQQQRARAAQQQRARAAQQQRARGAQQQRARGAQQQRARGAQQNRASQWRNRGNGRGR